MAVYLNIVKSGETPESVEYDYFTTDGRVGRFAINRTSGETCLIASAPGENENSLYHRAAFKIRKAWQAGTLPESACWAS